MIRTILAFLALASSATAQQQRPSAIVAFILDDVGVDSLAQVYTPNIDALAASGVTFTRAYSHAWCKPSRDSLLRGSYAGAARPESCLAVASNSEPTNLRTFVGSLRDAGYLTGVVGKWHIGRAKSDALPWWFAPHAFGFDHWWSGTAASAIGGCNPLGNVHNDGVFRADTKHPTLYQRDSVIDLIDEANIQGRPLFAWVGFTDAHSPWTMPPQSLLPGYFPPPRPSQRDLFEAEIIALDTVIGQIVAALPPDAWVIVMSENGTPQQVTVPSTTRAKTTVYERGVHVPLIFSGPGLTPGMIDDPVSLYDLPATLLDNLGIAGPHGNGRNILAPPPADAFAFVQNPTAAAKARAVIEARFKLIENAAGLEFYDLKLDPSELFLLPLAGPDFDRLQLQLDQLPGG